MNAVANSRACHSLEWLHETQKLTAELRHLIESVRSRSYPETSSRALRLRDVLAQTGDSKSALYKRIQTGEFPPPFHVGRSSRWLQSTVDACLAKRSGSALRHETMEVSA